MFVCAAAMVQSLIMNAVILRFPMQFRTEANQTVRTKRVSASLPVIINRLALVRRAVSPTERN